MKTSLCKLLGIELPIIQAPMAGGATTPDLVATVCEHGALGSFGFAYTQPEAMQRDTEAVRARTKRPFNVNLFAAPNESAIPADAQRAAIDALAPYYRELGLPAPQPVKPPYAPDLDAQLTAVEQIRPAVFTFHLGTPAPARLARLRELGVRIGGAATSVAEAKALEAAGVDFIIAQGAEAGGHRGTHLRDPYEAMTGTMALTRMVVRSVRLPVVAAGGIMDGAGIAAALALGAEAAQLGTAFVPCTESGASRVHKAAVLAAEEDTTLVTESFSGKPARGIANRFMREMDSRGAPHLAFPAQNSLMAPLRAAAAKTGNADFVALWSGQAAPLSRECSAADLIASLRDELREALQRITSQQGPAERT